MTPTGDRRAPTWQWIAVTAISLVGALGGLMLTDARTSIVKLQENKVDKTEYAQDMQDIKSMFREIKEQIRDHERNSARRGGR